MTSPDLSIIIVNWNTKALLRDCIASIHKFTKKITYEVIVVDNGSSDGSLEMLYQEFPQVTVIANKQNLGFAKANNQGMRKSKGSYVLLLNSDTRIDHDVLSQLHLWMQQHPEVGICGPKLLNTNGTLQPSSGDLPSLMTTFCNQTFPLHAVPFLNQLLPALKKTIPNYYANPHPVGWVSGAAFLFTQEIFQKTQGLDENLFMYVEEVELCKRVQDLGYQIWLVPNHEVWHLERGSSVSGKTNAILGVYKGLYYYFHKHKPRWQMPILTFFLKLGALIRLPRSTQTYKQALSINPSQVIPSKVPLTY